MKNIWVINFNGYPYEAYENTMKAQERYFELYEEYGSSVTRHQIELK